MTDCILINLNYSWPSIGKITHTHTHIYIHTYIYIYIYIGSEERTQWGDDKKIRWEKVGRREQKNL